VLFLIPPSETKTIGGTPAKFEPERLSFGALAHARREVLDAAEKAGALSDAQVKGVMPAIERYSGTLYSAIHGRGLKGTPTANNSLDANQIARAEAQVFIQSALLGLVSAADEIPEYKLSPSKKLGPINLKKHWGSAHAEIWSQFRDEIIIDLRSKAYADLAPIDKHNHALVVEVFFRAEDGSLLQMNHFNKKAKGQLVRAALLAKTAPTSIKSLCKLAAEVGLELTQDGRKLMLITGQAT
jgi:cytoplasmic iron level regulating protein YaaA (DUF328/UPF0246 family)